MSRFSLARRVCSFWSSPSSQEAFEGSNGIEELIVFQLLQGILDFDLFGTQCGDCLDISLGLGLATLADRIFAVRLEVIGQGVQEVLGEAIARTDRLTTGVTGLASLIGFQVFDGHSVSEKNGSRVKRFIVEHQADFLKPISPKGFS